VVGGGEEIKAEKAVAVAGRRHMVVFIDQQGLVARLFRQVDRFQPLQPATNDCNVHR
jgi:hypothetical protein